MKSRRLGPRSLVVNEEFVEIRTTLVDFLPGLVALQSRCQQTQCAFDFLVIYFLAFIYLLHDVGTLNEISIVCILNVETSHRTS